jgi:hypothetical protein
LTSGGVRCLLAGSGGVVHNRGNSVSLRQGRPAIRAVWHSAGSDSECAAPARAVPPGWPASAGPVVGQQAPDVSPVTAATPTRSQTSWSRRGT